MEGGNSIDSVSPQRQRSIFASRLNLLITAVIGITVLLAIVVAVILKKYSGPIQGANAAMTYQGAIAFALVFLSYGIAAIFLIMFFVYRILSPFKRMLKDMDEILTGDMQKRISLRDKDVFLIKEFVVGVNTLIAKLENMHTIKDELVCHIDAEGQQLISNLEQDEGISGKTRESVITYHKKIVSIVKDNT
ncbi:hypothetical protein [Candidatus Magnetominusculus xianensis]|uniref:HAMP domain-containing protein n=1 Tax=Candidatus Magnetominusculus xianensis TaxID=1748249 RepID=A0ABR5SFD5_9BACT|nr:hypothetical protein [Candidatus Magnetominusculus xianensis]KWT83507.1 hypothetical protein ASN18_2149 [Candidatus Magnetominusculus xianensis]MBF0405601.1 hypothetical protein [Nitrospirota bacterium]